MSKDTLDAELRNYARKGLSDGWRYLVVKKEGSEPVRYYDQDRMSSLVARFVDAYNKNAENPVLVFSGANVQRYREQCVTCHKTEDECECPGDDFDGELVRIADSLEGAGFVRADQVFGVRYLLEEDDDHLRQLQLAVADAEAKSSSASSAPAPAPEPVTLTPAPTPAPPAKEQPGTSGFSIVGACDA